MIDYRNIIRAKRLSMGISQTELAERLNITQPYLYQIESGRRTPSLDLFFQICEALDIRVFPDEQ